MGRDVPYKSGIRFMETIFIHEYSFSVATALPTIVSELGE